MYGFIILTPDSIYDGCWKQIVHEIKYYFTVNETFWCYQPSMETISKLYDWNVPYDIGMKLKFKFFTSGMLYALLVTHPDKTKDPSEFLNKLKGSAIYFERDRFTIRYKYNAINLFINLLHTSDSSTLALRDYELLKKYKITEHDQNILFFKNKISSNVVYYTKTFLSFYDSLISILSNFYDPEVICVENIEKIWDTSSVAIKIRSMLNNALDNIPNIKRSESELVQLICNWEEYSPTASERLSLLIKYCGIDVDSWRLLVLQTCIHDRTFPIKRCC